MTYVEAAGQGIGVMYLAGIVVALVWGLRHSDLVQASLYGMGVDRDRLRRAAAAWVLVFALAWLPIVLMWIMTDQWPEV